MEPRLERDDHILRVDGDVLGVGIEAEEEPPYRAFFSEVAQLCGRTVA